MVDPTPFHVLLSIVTVFGFAVVVAAIGKVRESWGKRLQTRFGEWNVKKKRRGLAGKDIRTSKEVQRNSAR